MMPEQKFNMFLRGAFHESDEDYMRVENITMSGVPDINICKSGLDVWVESKVLGREVLLRKEQFAWGMRRATVGGQVWVLADAQDYIIAWKFPNLICHPVPGDKLVSIERGIHEIIFERRGDAVKRRLFPTLYGRE